MKAYRRRKRGQALVEFALVFPIFLLAMFGLFDIGRAVFAYNEITNAAREGTRMAIVNQDVPTIEARMAAQMPGTVLSGRRVFSLSHPPPFPSATRAPLPQRTRARSSRTWAASCTSKRGRTTRRSHPSSATFSGPMTLTANSEASIEFVCPNPDIPEWDDPAECPKQNQ